MPAFTSTQPADLDALARTLTGINEKLDETMRNELALLIHGRSLIDLTKALHNAADPAAVRAAAELLAANEGGCSCSGDEPPEPTAEQLDEAADRLAREALAPFSHNPAWLARLQAIEETAQRLGASTAAGLSPT